MTRDTPIAGAEFDRPLRGLRVVDTTDETAWSSARLLADLGADVILVESHEREVDALYATRNANKRSVVLEDGELLQLSSHVDVWFDTGGTRLDVADVRLELPALIVVSISPFGHTGPYCDYEATHAVVYALCGQLPACRLPGRPPLLPPGQLAFEVGSAMAVYSALVAVWQRALTGRGAHLDLSMHEAMIQTIDTGIAGASVRRSMPDLPVTSAVATGGFGHPAFPTADGLVRPLVVSHRQWVALREWVGDPEELSLRRTRDIWRTQSPPGRDGGDLQQAVRGYGDRGDLRRGATPQRPRHSGDVPAATHRERAHAQTRHVRHHDDRWQGGGDTCRLFRIRRPPRRISPPRAPPRCRQSRRPRGVTRRWIAVRRPCIRRTDPRTG